MPSLRYETYKVILEFPYNAELVDLIKQRIPPKSREWNPTQKVWTVYTPYMKEARKLVFEFYPSTVEYNREAFESAEPEEPQRSQWASGGAKANSGPFRPPNFSDFNDFFRNFSNEQARRERMYGDFGSQSHAEDFSQDPDEEFFYDFHVGRDGKTHATRRPLTEEEKARRNRQRADDERARRERNERSRRYDWSGDFNFGSRGSGQRSYDKQTGAQTQSGNHATLFVLNSAPEEVVRAAYKALAIKHHPDKGGDTQTMQRINAAFDAIKKSKGWK